MKLINFTIIKLTAALVVGIIIAHLQPISANLAIITTLFTIAITLIAKLTLQKKHKEYVLGILIYITFIFIGILTTSVHDQKEFKTHYSHSLNKKQSKRLVVFRIREVLKSSLYHDKYVIDLLHINSKSVSGKSILNIKKDPLITALKTDAVLATTESFKTIKEPLNPGQFNYKNYLAKQYIYHQITTSNAYLFPLSKKNHTLFGYAAQFRNKIKKALKRYHFKPNELAIINALILGQRQDINTVIYDHYIKAGAIHILAVSGLHVGILLLLLNTLFKPLERFKKGYLIKVCLTLILLWGFAVIAGLSASVTRAVTMFSIVTIGTHLKRPVNLYNTLTFSIFILLLFKPLFIFDVGFQLSYVAVIAIVSIQPLLEQLWQPKWFVLKKVWQVLTVSIAAQLGVLPLSLFYFHQFPGLFFLSNLIIIPCLGFILGFGILIIILAVLDCLPEFIANFYGLIINYLNQFIKWIALQDHFIFQDISFNTLLLITSYFLIIAFVRSILIMNYKRLVFLLMTIALFQSSLINNKLHLPPNKFIIFHKNRETVIAKKTNTLLTLYSDSTYSKQNKAFRNYKITNRIDSIIKVKSSPIYKIRNKYMLVIDSNSIYTITRFCPDYILLTNTPKINLNRVIDSIQPALIIADGSNYKSQVLKWKRACENKKIPFHYTGKKGAFILESD